MNKENLKLLGLTNNEIEIYLFILREGKSRATDIRKKTALANSRVYAALDSLIEKGIITYEKTPKGKLYNAPNPEIIKELFKERQEKIESIIPELKEIQQKEKSETETAVYEGFNGFKTALYNFVNECPKGETVYIIGFSNQAYKNEKLAALLRDVNKISVNKKHKFKMILDNKENKFFQERKNEKIFNIKFMDKGFKSPASIDIFQDTVYILMWDENPYVFKIKNKNIAEGFKTYFNFLWNIAIS